MNVHSPHTCQTKRAILGSIWGSKGMFPLSTIVFNSLIEKFMVDLSFCKSIFSNTCVSRVQEIFPVQSTKSTTWLRFQYYLYWVITFILASQVALVVKNPPATSGDSSLIPGSERSPGVGNGNPLQDSCQGNSMHRGAWWAIQSIGQWRIRHNWTTEHVYTKLLAFLSPQTNLLTNCETDQLSHKQKQWLNC